MTLRDNLTPLLRWAHQTLDMVKAGLPVLDTDITRALVILGDVE